MAKNSKHDQTEDKKKKYLLLFALSFLTFTESQSVRRSLVILSNFLISSFDSEHAGVSAEKGSNSTNYGRIPGAEKKEWSYCRGENIPSPK